MSSYLPSSSARMRSHGLVRVAVEQQQQPPQPVASAGTVATVPPAEEGVDSVGPSLCMPNGKPISPSALPPGPSRAALQKAILTQDSERSDVQLRGYHPNSQFMVKIVTEIIELFFSKEERNTRQVLIQSV